MPVSGIRRKKLHRVFFLLLFAIIFFSAGEGEQSRELAFLQKAKSSTVFLLVRLAGTTYTPQGTGILISADGKILTTAHLVSGEVISSEGITYLPVESVTAYFSSGTNKLFARQAKIVNRRLDPNVDTALLQVEGEYTEFLSLPPTLNLKENEEVWALGYPMGVELSEGKQGPEIRIFHGNIVNLRVNPRGEVVQIEHNAPLFPGASGGPLLNSRGELIGMNAWATAQDTRIAFSSSFLYSLLTSAAQVEATRVRSTPFTDSGISPQEIPGLQWYLPVDDWKFTALDGDGTLFVVYQKALHRIQIDGKPLWTVPLNGTPCCPPALSSHWIALFAPPFLSIFDKDTGQLLSQFSPENHLVQYLSFTPDSLLLLFGFHSGAYVYDLQGKLKWFIRSPPLQGPPLALPNEQYLLILRGDAKIQRYQKTKKLGDIAFPTYLGDMPVDSGEGWFVVKGYPGPVYAFTLDGKILWKSKEKTYAKTRISVYPDERVLFVDSSGRNLIRIHKGEEQWRFRLPSPPMHWGNPAVGKEGHIAIVSHPPLGLTRFTQQLWILDDQGTPLWKLDTPEVNQPCLSDPLFFPDGSLLIPFRTNTVLPDGRVITLAVGKVEWKTEKEELPSPARGSPS
ncbi:MAG: trypsin-like peptidase domain-containing protein [bacterium JZ-2024 1]